MTVDYLNEMGYDYQFGREKWSKKRIETMKKWHYWGIWVGQFIIDGYWYKVFTN